MKQSSNILGIMAVTVATGLVATIITGTNVFRQSGVDSVSKSTAPPLPKTEYSFEVAGWIPDWSSESGLESIKRNSKKLTNISPVWYEAQPDGTLKNKKPAQAQAIVAAAVDEGLEITPSVALFDHEILTSIFANPQNLQTHIDQIVTAGSEPNINGIDIDYESTKLTDKEGYFKLLRGISDGLHAKGKKVIITVVAQWGNNIRYLSLIETRQVQDWSMIANFADEIRIMAYDYTWQGAPFSGPIAPLDWQEKVIQYALTKVNPSKIVLGIHLYAYEKYIEKPKAGSYTSDLLPFVTDWERNLGDRNDSRAYTYTTIQKIFAENTVISDEKYEGERVIRYSKLNKDTGKYEDRITVFIDQEGIASRFFLAKKYNLRGVAFWRLGGEGDLLQGIT